MMTQMMAAMRSSAAAAVAPGDVVVVVVDADGSNMVAVVATMLVQPQCLGCPVAAWVDAEVDATAMTLRHGQMFV